MTTEEGPWASGSDGKPDWSEATRHLSERDPVLRALIRRIGPCTLAPRPNVFGTLVGAIVAQQISAAAARSIHKRLWALTRGQPPGPRDILKRREATLRRVGLSRQKIAYLRDLAARVDSGELDLRALEAMQDDAVRAALTAVKGIGNWTADMHLIFTQNRPDVFAPGTPRCSSRCATSTGCRTMRRPRNTPDQRRLAAVPEHRRLVHVRAHPRAAGGPGGGRLEFRK